MKKLVLSLCLLTCLSRLNISFAATDTSGKAIEKPDKQLLLDLVNSVRKSGCNCGGVYYKKVAPVSWNDKLEKAAQIHSKEMLTKQYFSHVDKNGNDAGTRLTEAGYQWQTYGENIASGILNEREVIAGWLHSPGHCKNIMNKDFREMGVAKAGSYWTQIFAAGR